MDLSAKAWEHRYVTNDIGWDLGQVSPALKKYFDQLTNKELKILIPGGGNSYEVEYLFNKGFTNVFVIDLSKTAIENIKKSEIKYHKTGAFSVAIVILKQLIKKLVMKITK